MLPLEEGTGTVWPRTGLLTKHHDIGALPNRLPRGVWGEDRHASSKPANPTVHRSWLSAPSPDPGYRIRYKSRRGVEKQKGKEQIEIVARGRSSRRALQGQIVTIFAAVTPHGRLQNARGGFFPAVSPIT